MRAAILHRLDRDLVEVSHHSRATSRKPRLTGLLTCSLRLICARASVWRLGAIGTVGFFGDLKEGIDFLRDMADTLTVVGMIMMDDILMNESNPLKGLRWLRRRSKRCER